MLTLMHQPLKTLLNDTLDAKKRMLQVGDTTIENSHVREEIKASWKRSIKLGVAYDKVNLQKLDSAELAKRYSENRLLLDLGSQAIDSVNRILNYNQCSISLTDQHGILMYTNTTTNKTSFQSDNGLGRCFAEAVVGTNSISLALHLNRNVTVIGPEHYGKEFENNCSTTAIIKNVYCDIIGTITVTHHINDLNNFSQGLAPIIAAKIESEIRATHYAALLDKAFNAVGKPVIVLDNKLRIEKVNQSFLDLINATKQDLDEVNVKRLFKNIDMDSVLADTSTTIIEQPLSLNIFDKIIHVQATIIPIYTNNKFDSLMISCNKPKSSGEAQTKSKILTISKESTETGQLSAKIITQDPQLKKIIQDCKRVANLDVPVLIEGESGVGKELFAELIYKESNRYDNSFIAVNCAALPANLIESELFGYEKGAFTGGLPDGKPGKFEMAQGGVIFLDEVGELSLDFQAKLLRVLDNNKCVRIGGSIEHPLDLKVVSATNRNLRKEVEENNFRSDLYYRLNVIDLKIPPLRERRGDIALLSEHFISQLNNTNDMGMKKKLNQEVLNALINYQWDGNVRELHNVLIRAFYLCRSDEITKEHLPAYMQDVKSVSASTISKKKTPEYRLIYDALVSACGKVAKASEELNMPISTLYRKISQYGIDLKEMH